MQTEELFDQPLPIPVANRRTYSLPDGQPRPTGHYPNHRGSQPGGPIYGNVVFDQLYPGTVDVGSLDGTQRVDQHSFLQVSATWTPAPEDTRPSGRRDPLTDGPPQPFLDDMSVWYNRRQGTSVTAFLNAPGVEFPRTGQQDGSSWTYLQSTGLALEPYSQARLQADGQMPDTLRALPPSPPHGWTEQPPLKPQAENNLKAAALVQQKNGRQDLLSNSTYAGQSYGARTRHVGQNSPASSTLNGARGATGGRGR